MKGRLIRAVLTLAVVLSVLSNITACASGDIQIGDYVKIGTYNGQPILWRCVDIDENGPLMLSDKILCLKAFDASGDNTTGSHGRGIVNGEDRKEHGSNYWADSNIRCWLNSGASAGDVAWLCDNPPDSSHIYDGCNAYDKEAGFLTGFSDLELEGIKTVIQDCILYRNEYSNISTYGSRPHIYSENIFDVVKNAKTTAYRERVTDRIFLLDVRQINNVYQNDSQLGGNKYYIGIPTAEAVENSEYKNENLNDATGWWSWLRTPSVDYACYDYSNCYYGYSVRYVSGDGCIYADAYSGEGGVRPAFYLDLSSVKLNGDKGTENEPYTIGWSLLGTINNWVQSVVMWFKTIFIK